MAAGVSVDVARDPLGAPVATLWSDGTTTTARYQLWGNPGAELPLVSIDDAGNASVNLALEGQLLGVATGASLAPVATDAMGSVVLDASGFLGVPEAFGTGAESQSVAQAYAGLEAIPEMPYQLARARAYDPTTGRFASQDPIGLAGGDHRFAYAASQPTGFSDPSGLAYRGPAVASTQLEGWAAAPAARGPQRTSDERNAELLAEMAEYSISWAMQPYVDAMAELAAATASAESDPVQGAGTAGSGVGSGFRQAAPRGKHGRFGSGAPRWDAATSGPSAEPVQVLEREDGTYYSSYTVYREGPTLDLADFGPVTESAAARHVQAHPSPSPGGGNARGNTHAWEDRRTMLLTGFNRAAMLSIATFAMYGPSGPGWEDIAFGGLRQGALHALERDYDRVTQPSMSRAVTRTPGAENWYAAGMPLEIAAEAVASAGAARAAAGLGRGLATSAAAAERAAAAEVAEAMGRYFGCLAPGTPVLTSRGWIHIEDVREGDLAWACDGDTTGGCQFRRVTATSVKDGRVLWRVDLLDATGAPASLDVTPMHPVAVTGRGWVPAMDLEIGDQLLNLDGNPVEVTGARPLPGLHRVHNFTVARAHTYFAGGDGGVWVHNTSAISSVDELLGGSLGAVELPAALRGGESATHVYLGARSGESVYVGITNDLDRRASQHAARFGIRPITVAPLLRGEARAVEQALIERNPGYENIRNSISPRHPYYRQAVAWGEAWLRGDGR